MVNKVCVYCASSDQAHPDYYAAARRLGELLAEDGIELVYGGGARGSMGAVANGALSRGGRVTGILPKFMDDLEWGHPSITDLQLVEDMHERKHQMLTQSEAVVALPGGAGTFEELFEAISFKKLALFLGPIILLNTRGFYDPCAALLEKSVTERFMGDVHNDIWTMVDTPEDVIPAIHASPTWTESHREHAVVKPDE
ncbi:MAG: TIGR00730 family Rossman fold protein [Xanthomonadales bacterium]|nr:TIGR00730 family Rossman fold protein [Xanthomonadales bacterium]